MWFGPLTMISVIVSVVQERVERPEAADLADHHQLLGQVLAPVVGHGETVDRRAPVDDGGASDLERSCSGSVDIEQ